MIHDWIEASKAWDEGKVDYTLTYDNFWMGDLNVRLWVRPGTETGVLASDYHIEENALRQLCGKLGPVLYGQGERKMLPFEYLNALRNRGFGETFSRSLEALFNAMDRDTEFYFRTYGDNLRAVLSPRYAPVANTDILQMVGDVIDSIPERKGYDLVRPVVERDYTVMRVIVKEILAGPGEGRYGLGFQVRNNEIGRGALVMQPLVQKNSCANSITVMHNHDTHEGMGLRLIHLGATEGKTALIANAITEVLPFAENVLERYIQCKDNAISDMWGAIKVLGKKQGWSDTVQMSVAMGTNRRDSVADLVDGITWAAHKTEKNHEAAADMETVAGNLLFDIKGLKRLLSRERIDVTGHRWDL